jgi:hypothetical protein
MPAVTVDISEDTIMSSANEGPLEPQNGLDQNQNPKISNYIAGMGDVQIDQIHDEFSDEEPDQQPLTVTTNE